MRSFLALLLIIATPASAEIQAPAFTPAQRAVPAMLTPTARAAFRQAFLDIDAGRVAAARSALAQLPDSKLADALRAEILLAQGGKAPLAEIAAWLARNPDAPQAARLAAAARARGAVDLPSLPAARPMSVRSFNASMAPRAAKIDSSEAEALARAVKPLLSADRPSEAEARWRETRDSVSEPVRTEWAYRTAWSHFLASDDEGAIRMGAEATQGQGQWAALGAWVAGLGAWRINDCERAARHFDLIATKGPSTDLAAAGAYWASRAHMACGRPHMVTQRLQQASREADSFYGLLARRALGLDATQNWREPDFIQADWNHLAKIPGAQRAAALVEIGQLGRADRELRHLASITDPANHDALMRLAARLNMPATQYWLAHRPPSGSAAPITARFPAPDWAPYRGWRIDKALVYAHALQESNFVTDATSRAGARGIMQLMPGTARKVSRDIGEVHDAARLTDPSFNIEYGQTYLEELRDSVWTQGLLPKVIAAYNAGPGSVQKWNARLRDNGDPLLFIESIPFAETRHYVEVVLRNYWMYQQKMGVQNTSIDAIAQGMWPRFPGLPGPTAVKLDSVGTTASAH